jgi:hypothetical protein
VLSSDRSEPDVIPVPPDRPLAIANNARNSDSHNATAIAEADIHNKRQTAVIQPSAAPDPPIAADDDWEQPIPGIARSDDSAAMLINSGLVIINPPATGGIVHYIVDGEVCSLLPTEYHRFAGDQTKKVVFHKGDDFPDATETIAAGVFVFLVTDDGWELKRADFGTGLRLLKICRIAEKIATGVTLNAAVSDPPPGP